MEDWRDRLAVYPAWNMGTLMAQGDANFSDLINGNIQPSGQPGSIAGPKPFNSLLGGGPYSGLGNEVIIDNPLTTLDNIIITPFPYEAE